MRYLITAAVIAGILATACTAATPSSTTPQTVTKTETSAPIAADTQVPASPVDTTPSYTVSQQNAIRSAQEYLSSQAFSYTGLISQLSSKYGEGFAKADAVFAVNHIQVNWNDEAAKAAKEYLQSQAFSCSGLTSQLESSYGEDFTHAQAVYGANQTGVCG